MFGIKKINFGYIILGTFIASFGLYNIHEQFMITEGGVFGAMLLVHHWTKIPVSILSIIMDGMCYALAFKFLGFDFIKKSFVATLLMMVFLAIFEMFPPLIPLSFNNLVVNAVIGGLFIGVGVGLVIRFGGSCGGDDVLALILSKKFDVPLKFSYLFTDLSVLILSLTYIPLSQIKFSLITVVVSSVLIDFVNSYKRSVHYENQNI